MIRVNRGFTLVELLTCISIIAILAAVFIPVVNGAKAAVYQSIAAQSLKQVMSAATMYASDHDDLLPPALYATANGGVQTWCSRREKSGRTDRAAGLLSAYYGNKVSADPTLHAKSYLGNGMGYGYNWGNLGSDFHLTRDYSTFPNCSNPAAFGQIAEPSRTVVFSTSSYYYAPWQGGDGNTYDFAFIDPPQFWEGNPNVDFRHRGSKTVDPVSKQVVSHGIAVVAFADTSVRPLRSAAITDAMFVRDAATQVGAKGRGPTMVATSGAFGQASTSGTQHVAAPR